MSTIYQLSNNNFIDESPQIWGNNVVWQGNDGNDYEIFFYDGTGTVQLTDNDTNDYLPQISGKNIVWQGHDGNDNEIFFYDDTNIIQLTNNDTNDHSAQISGKNIVWQGNDGNDDEIFFHDGINTVQLTDNDTDDYLPQISGNNVVWASGYGAESEINLYDGTNTIQLTNNDIGDSVPKISGNNVVWASGYGAESEINLYDGTTTIQLTDNDPFPDLNPQISGNNVVWTASPPPVGNVRPPVSFVFYSGTSYETITPQISRVYDYHKPEISGNNVVWVSSDPILYAYNGTTTTQIEGAYGSQPQISGDNVVFVGSDGDPEIYLTVLENDDLSEQGLIELYSFRNITIDSDTHNFVGKEERDAILVNPDFNQTFSLENVAEDGAFNSAFVASVTPRSDLLPFYRLRSLDTPGTNLFVSTEEYNSIFIEGSEQRDKWVKEGINPEGVDIPEFYLYGVGANQGIEFHRFQHLDNHTFLYADPELTATINSDPNMAATFINQGVAFEVF